jgi:hypothetical protein
MENSNPQGTVETVNDAANAFLGMMEPEEPQGQPDGEVAQQQEESAEYEAQENEQAEEYQEEQQETPKYRVKAGDEEVEVDLDELIKGYSRTSDYTKKTQNLAEQRKAVEAERARIDEAARLRDQYAQRLQVIEQMLQSPEEDLTALKDQDPIGYAVKMGEKMERERQLAAVRAEREQVVARQQMEYQQRLSQTLSAEAERLKAAIPGFADEQKSQIIRKEIKDAGKNLKFTEEELSAVYDHRAVLALWKAAQYDKLMNGKAQTTKKVSEAPRMLKPGTTQPRNAKDEQMGKLRKQLSNSGKKQDAAKLFEQFL